MQLITDVNIAVAVEAIQAIGNLARGLRTHFSGSSRFLLPVLLVSKLCSFVHTRFDTYLYQYICIFISFIWYIWEIMLSGFLWPSLFLLFALCPFCFNKFPFDYAIGLSIYGPKNIRTFENLSSNLSCAAFFERNFWRLLLACIENGSYFLFFVEWY